MLKKRDFDKMAELAEKIKEYSEQFLQQLQELKTELETI